MISHLRCRATLPFRESCAPRPPVRVRPVRKRPRRAPALLMDPLPRPHSRIESRALFGRLTSPTKPVSALRQRVRSSEPDRTDSKPFQESENAGLPDDPLFPMKIAHCSCAMQRLLGRNEKVASYLFHPLIPERS